jgi:hypothetical protein
MKARVVAVSGGRKGRHAEIAALGIKKKNEIVVSRNIERDSES